MSDEKLNGTNFIKPTRLVSMHDCSFGNFIRYAIHHKSTCCFFDVKNTFFGLRRFFLLFYIRRGNAFTYTIFFSMRDSNRNKIFFVIAITSVVIEIFPSNWVVKSKDEEKKNHEKGMKWKQGRTYTFEWKKKFLSLVEGSIRRKKTTWYGENNG